MPTLSRSGSKLKRTELPFSQNLAAPNSRLLFASAPPLPTAPPGFDTKLLPSSKSNRPSSIRSNRSSKSLKSSELGQLGSGNGSRISLNAMESFEDSSASESDDELDDEIIPPLPAPIPTPPLAEVSSESTSDGSSKSRAALLAIAAMERPTKEVKRLGKPLHTLTPNDVKLSEKDLKADIQEIWTAM